MRLRDFCCHGGVMALGLVILAACGRERLGGVDPSCALSCAPAAGSCLALGVCAVGASGPGCEYMSKPDGASCALATGAAGYCAAGACAGCGSAADCDDGDACTADSCNVGVCSHTNTCGAAGCTSAAQCSDGDPCTTDTCASGACAHTGACAPPECTSAAQCDDGNACTTDSCSTSGTCVHSGACAPVCTEVATGDGCPVEKGGGCRVGGHCASGTCSYTVVADGTACDLPTLAGGGLCASGNCVEAPYDTRSYGTPPPTNEPWCPMSGVGLPAVQYVTPIPAASCPVIGAAQQAYGNCPLWEHPLANFEDTDPTSLASGRALFDLRWLRFSGVKSLRFKMPTNPVNVNFGLTDFAWGAYVQGYRVSISEDPCDVSPAPAAPTYSAALCEAGGPNLTAAVGHVVANPSAPCNGVLRPGHIYYFNIYGNETVDPAEDGVIDAGDRLLITIEFLKP